MLVPISWLKQYVDIPVSMDELEEKLFSCGFEVEEKYEVGRDISNVVVGLVEECELIEGTHLHLCKVNAGSYGTFQICCGADNVRVGKKFALALEGATVYATAKDHVTVEGVTTIHAGKLRGYDSFGMLCGGAEIGLNDDLFPGGGYNGLVELPDDAIPGEDVKPIVGLDDWIFDIALTANRPDCQSIVGIAREVSAVLGTAFHEPDYSFTENGSDLADFKVTVEDKDLCPRYIGHYVSDIQMGESPAWMKRYLSLVGIRSISNIVDITNFVLKELGQPMHAFDAEFLGGHEIIVRRAKNGEKIVTLDEKEFELDENNLVICDATHPVALAGIMGGLNSEIRETTKGVVFESAKFARDNIRKTSRKLGQSSDSSAVFSKGVQEYTTEKAMKRALHLIEKLGCGKVSKTSANVNSGNSLEPKEMRAKISKINGVLGVHVPTGEIEKILTRLNFNPEISGDDLTIRVPRYREDMEDYPDIAEEVIRMYGYDHIKSTFIPSAKVTPGGRNVLQNGILSLKRALAAAGAYEGIHYSFFSPADLDLLKLPADAKERKAISILNPINIDLSLMRTTLAPQMIQSMARNEKRGTLEGAIFEIGSIFISDELPLKDYPDERLTASVGVFGEKATFYDLKGFVQVIADTLNTSFEYESARKPFLHPYRTANILWNGQTIGYLGEVSYEIQNELDMRTPAYVAELDLAVLTDLFGKAQIYTPIPKFAVETRDFAFVVGTEVTCAEIEKEIYRSCPFITEVHLFDVYEGAQVGENRKSMAFSVTFTPTDHEFKDEELDGFVQTILKNLEATKGAILRS